MADNVEVDSGTGINVATEDESGVHYQKIKLTASGSGTVEDLTKAEDSAHTGGHHGIMFLAVRQSTSTDMSAGGTDGDYEPLQVDASGRLYVNNQGIVQPVWDNGDSLTVDNGGTFAVQVTSAIPAGTNAIGKLAANSGVIIGDINVVSQVPGFAATNLGKREDDAHASQDVGVMGLAVRQSSPANLSSANGDYEPLQVNGGLLWTVVRGVQTPNGDSMINDTADAMKVILTDPSDGQPITAGSEYTEGSTDSSISGVALMFESNTGSNTISVVNATTPLPVQLQASTLTTEVVGDAAHDAAISGNPVRLGARADTALSTITAVADGDTTDLYAGIDGVLIVRPHANLEDHVSDRATNTDGASTAFGSGLAAPGSGIRLYLTSVTICNSSETFCTVDIRDGAAGSVLWTFPAPATSGVTHTFTTPLKFTANTAVAFDASAATSTLTISAAGFKSKVG